MERPIAKRPTAPRPRRLNEPSRVLGPTVSNSGGPDLSLRKQVHVERDLQAEPAMVAQLFHRQVQRDGDFADDSVGGATVTGSGRGGDRGTGRLRIEVRQRIADSGGKGDLDRSHRYLHGRFAEA